MPGHECDNSFVPVGMSSRWPNSYSNVGTYL